MKKILLLGLSSTTTESAVRTWLNRYGLVWHVEFFYEGDASKPLAVVEMDITDGLASLIVSRISSYWYDGTLVSAQLLIH